MRLIELIRQHALAAAIGADWSAVATAAKSLGLRAELRTCSSVETAGALAAVGVNWAAVMVLIDGDAVGRFLLTKMAAEGVAWGHPLTVPYLRSKQGSVLTVAGVDALIELSSPLLFPGLTAEQCQVAWENAIAEDVALQTAATQSARVASIESIDAAAIVDGSADLLAAVEAIRSHLIAFGGW
jgi:hypothetical protein